MDNKLVKRLLGVQDGEYGRVVLLLIMSFFMGSFLATFTVAAQTLFLDNLKNDQDLAIAFMMAGGFGLIATLIYNFLQTRVHFSILALSSLAVITVVTGLIEFGEHYIQDTYLLHMFAFTQQVPFTLIILLLFWGAFNRMFNVRQAKRLLGSVDQGALIASLISFFTIPLVLDYITIDNLYTISLISIFIFSVLFVILSSRAGETWSRTKERQENKKVGIITFMRTRYLVFLSIFITISVIALYFIDYSFLTVSTQMYNEQDLAKFLSYFEATVVIFSFLFQAFAADRVVEDYGLRISILVNPALLGIFTVVALAIGLFFGYTADSPSFLIFFIMIAMSQLFLKTVKESLDEPVFKLYQLPVEPHLKNDVQTKIEGIVTAVAVAVAGALIYLINAVNIFDNIFVTIFAIPIIAIWFYSGVKMYASYRKTLRETLIKNKSKVDHREEQEYTVDRVLQKEVGSSIENKVIYGLRLMEKLEPALFENALLSLVESPNTKVRSFALAKMNEIGLERDGQRSVIKDLANQAVTDTQDSDLLSISPEKLMKLSKSVKANDRILAAKLLRRLTNQRNIFILLELLRDVDLQVRQEALVTARKLKRPETWPVLIELLASPLYGNHAAAALIEGGEQALNTLETAFHKSGQSHTVMLRIVQIIGRVGGDEAFDLLWKKADYPDKRIVKQILYSLRYANFKPSGRQAQQIVELLENELSKSLWNQAALSELPPTPDFDLLRSALEEEIKSNFDHIMMLMSILYDPEAVQLVRQNIESGDPNGLAYAIELMDLFVDQELKPKIFPLIDDSPIEKKLEELQVHFPRESYNPIQVINYILNRDFNLNNRWTKVCAVYTAAYMNDFRVSRGLIAQMFNSDKLLQETAAWVIYNKDRSVYDVIVKRLPEKEKRFLDTSIENNQLLDGLNDGFFLGIEIIMVLKQLPEFKNISGVLLADLFDKITAFDLKQNERLTFNPTDPNTPILIIAHGTIQLRYENKVQQTLKAGDVYGDIFALNEPLAPIDLAEASERTVLLKINLMDFFFVMATHHELVEGLIKNTNTKQLA